MPTSICVSQLILLLLLCVFLYVISVGGTTVDKSSKTVKKKILENHLPHSEHHTDWGSRNGERDLKFMQKSLALEMLGAALSV